MTTRTDQRNKVLEHLRIFGSITPVEAETCYGCRRLAARIHELRAHHRIRTQMVSIEGINPFARYVLESFELQQQELPL
jgi:hypothetical protein